jgi:hypothetical protein
MPSPSVEARPNGIALAREAPWLIMRLAGQAQYRRSRLTSKVRRRKLRFLMRSTQDTFSPLRQFLLLGALGFMRTASRLPGVRQIVLIGSLTTDKADPKDIDLLLTVADDLDLERLASAGRRLKGRAQGRSSGADIFLLNPRGEYIGRTCQWRECVPGIRVACRADHCGRRHYLYDDLRVIKLTQALVSAPPLQLWPTVVSHGALPGDVQAWLVNVQESLYASGRNAA